MCTHDENGRCVWCVQTPMALQARRFEMRANAQRGYYGESGRNTMHQELMNAMQRAMSLMESMGDQHGMGQDYSADDDSDYDADMATLNRLLKKMKSYEGEGEDSMDYMRRKLRLASESLKELITDRQSGRNLLTDKTGNHNRLLTDSATLSAQAQQAGFKPGKRYTVDEVNRLLDNHFDKLARPAVDVNVLHGTGNNVAQKHGEGQDLRISGAYTDYDQVYKEPVREGALTGGGLKPHGTMETSRIRDSNEITQRVAIRHELQSAGCLV